MLIHSESDGNSLFLCVCYSAFQAGGIGLFSCVSLWFDVNPSQVCQSNLVGQSVDELRGMKASSRPFFFLFFVV